MSLPNLIIFLYENDFCVPVVDYFSNFPNTLFICVRSSSKMRHIFRPLQLRKKEELFFSFNLQVFFFLHRRRNFGSLFDSGFERIETCTPPPPFIQFSQHHNFQLLYFLQFRPFRSLSTLAFENIQKYDI